MGHSFTNYNPVKVFFESEREINLAPFVATNAKTWVIASETILDKWPQLYKSLPANAKLMTDVSVNPDINIIDGIEKPPSVTQVIGIGGGSVLDTAKALFAKILTKGQYTLNEIIDSPQVLDETFCITRNKNKLILVPTTFGTSSEITKWATIWDWQKKKKYSLSHEALYADSAVIIPALSLSLSRYFTASTGLDVLSHALESVWNKENNYLTRLNAIESIRICAEYLPKLLNQLDSIEYRTEMAKASLLAGMAFSQTKTAAAHSLSYPLTLFHDIPHGYACSLTLGSMFEYNYSVHKTGLSQVLKIFQKHYGSEDIPFKDCFDNFLTDCRVPKKLSDFSVKDTDISQLVSHSFHPERFNNMVGQLTAQQVKDIFHDIL